MADELELEAEIKKVWWPRGVPNGRGDIPLPLLPPPLVLRVLGNFYVGKTGVEHR